MKNDLLKIFIVLCGVMTVALLSKTLKRPDIYLSDTNQYNHVKDYLEISKNAHKKGPLVSGDEGNYKIYAIGYNDPAFPILVSALSLIGFKFSSPSDIQFINLFLLWLSLFCFLLIFLKKNLLTFSVVQLLIIFYLYTMGIEYSSRFADQHSTVSSLTIFTFFLVEFFFGSKVYRRPFVFYSFFMEKFHENPNTISIKWQCGKLFVLSVLGGLFGMFRNYFSYIFIFLVGLSSVNLLKSKTGSIWLNLGLSLFALLIVLNLSGFLQRGFYYCSYIKNPDLFVTSSLSEQSYGHGIWHNLYLGLGVFKNKWGIQWNDTVGFEHARRYNPEAIYPDPKHYTTMKELYFKYLKEEPVEYVINHIKKIFMTMFTIVKKNLILIIIFLLTLHPSFLRHRSQAIKRASVNPVHIIPFFIFFIIPVVTTLSFVSAITTYTSLIIITLVARNLEFRQQSWKI